MAFYTGQIRRMFTVLVVCLAGWGVSAAAAPSEQATRREFEGRFLKFCDLAAAELNKELTPFTSRTNADPATHHMPFFEDAHAVRALAVAYDMTGKRAYLDACRRWSDRMIAYQGRMIPQGGLLHEPLARPGPGQGPVEPGGQRLDRPGRAGDGHALPGPADKARYLARCKAFAQLVMDNYVGPEGGI